MSKPTSTTQRHAPRASRPGGDRATRQVAAAMAVHRAGRLDEAMAAYRAVLAAVPEHPDALHLMGMLEAQRGKHAQAEALIARAIAVRPREPMFHNNLGNVCLECGRLDEAEAHFRAALALDPDRPDALNNLAVLLGRRGRLADAEQALTRVVHAAPLFADAWQNLVTLLMRAGRLAEAVDACRNGLAGTPRHVELRRLLALGYARRGDSERAIEVYEEWLRDDPANVVARHHLAALRGVDVPDRASDAYVQTLFDGFAGSFDANLASLDYRAPQLVAGAAVRALDAPARSLEVVDAGCGTGLCGPLLAPHARTLVGVDLSAGMLQRARLRGCYDELVQAELVAFLRTRAGAFDLIVCADTLCYFGPLEAACEAAARALRGPARFVFTVEAAPEVEGAPGHVLHTHGRYSHRRGAVEAALAQAGFDTPEVESHVLRTEGKAPVRGWLVSAHLGRDQAHRRLE